MTSRVRTTGVPRGAMVLLSLSVLKVSMGFGVVLPLLPYLIERLLGAGAGAGKVSRSTGFLTGLYKPGPGRVRSAAGGLLFDVAAIPGASFVGAAALTVLGLFLSLALPEMLVARKLDKRPRGGFRPLLT